VRNNVEITLRERGKIVARRSTHNIWASAGQYWLTQLVSLDASGTPLNDKRIRYMGFGIGGCKQSSAAALVPPLSTDFPGTNIQTNTQYNISTLERPCLVTSTTYMKEIQVVSQPTPYSLRLETAFSTSEITYDATDHAQMPLSEVGLFLNGADTSVVTNPVMGYDVFPTAYKTNANSMHVVWIIRL
jgi:hypothetical protein